MKAIQLLPLAYLANVHGFIYFVPYMIFVLFIGQALAVSRRCARNVRKLRVRLASTLVPSDDEGGVLAIVLV